MIQRTPLTLAALYVIGVTSLSGRTIEVNTVYMDECPWIGACGEQLIVVDGLNPPTVLDFVDPAFLFLEAPPPLPPNFENSPAVALAGSSMMRMIGGRIRTDSGGPPILATEQSVVTVTGGEISGVGGIIAIGQARVDVSGGSVFSDIDSGTVGALSVLDDARAEVTGGQLIARFDLAAYAGGNGHLIVSGGLLTGMIAAGDNGIIDLFSGSFDGRIDRFHITAGGESTINFYGGMLRDDDLVLLVANESASINVFGTDFVLGPIEPGDRRRLTGTLADGNSIDVFAIGNIVPHEIELQPGDANRDLAFDELDLVQVLQSAKYLTGDAATWGEGDWNGAPGGIPGNPPRGDGVFDQLDIVAALAPGHYLTGPYAGLATTDAAVAAVPEPSGVALIVLGVFALTLRRTQLRRRCHGYLHQ